MRLSEREVKIIKHKIQSIFGEAVVYLFGSRVNDAKEGGDIDLYIVPKYNKNLFKKKIKIKTILEDILYKPVDIVVAKDENRLIEREAVRGVIL